MAEMTAYIQESAIDVLHRSGISLSATEEHDLFISYATEPDDRARMAIRDKLTRANIRFVISVAYEYTRNTELLNDLVCCGNIGLLDAIERFDPNAGIKFISYAVWHVRKHMLAYMYENTAIRVPRDQVMRMQKELRDNPDNPDIDRDVFVAMNVGSLDTPVLNASDSSTASLIDLIADDAQIHDCNARESIEHSRWILESGLDSLDDKELVIITKSYGLGGGELNCDKDIADSINLSRERVRQLRQRAIKKLKIKCMLTERVA